MIQFIIDTLYRHPRSALKKIQRFGGYFNYNKTMKDRDYLMDLMRFVAALWVTLYHFNGEPFPYVNNWYRDIAKFGYLGVPIFFVISGYCIILTATKAKSTFDFLGRRAFRIYPTYWFSLLAVLGAAVFQRIVLGQNSITVFPRSFIDISATLALLTHPFSTIHRINGVYWTLTYEIFFYMVIAIGLLFRTTLRLHFLLFISILALVIPTHEHGPLFFLANWPVFALGMCIYIFQYKPYPNSQALTVSLIIINLYTLINNCLVTDHVANLITVIITVLLIISGQYWRMKNNIFSRLGDYSYAIYLIHVPVGIHIFGLIKSATIRETMWYNIAFDMSSYFIISCMAYFIFKYVESPCIQYGKHFLKTRSNKLKSVYEAQS